MRVWIDYRIEVADEHRYDSIFETVVRESLRYEGFSEACEVSISVVDDDEIHQINKQFRRIDRPTDVLSFPLLTFFEGEKCEKNACGEVLLGDIVISLERAREQAAQYGHLLQREMAFLTAHSMLHLLGYDHMNEEEEAEMFRRQKEILIIAGFPKL